MRQLIMDGTEVDLQKDYAQLGELLDSLTSQIPDGRIISHLYLDDREVMEQQHEHLREQALGGVQAVRVVTSPLVTQVGKNVTDLLGFLKEMRPLLRQSGRELRYGAVANASTKLADCFEGMETAVRSIEQLMNLLPLLNAGLSDEEFAQFSNKEGDLLGQLVSDFERKDWLSLADRIEFQLDPLMGRWQTVLNRVQTSIQSSASTAN